MNTAKASWTKLEPATRTLVILVITAVVILIVLLLIRRLVAANRRKNNAVSDSSNSSGSTASDSSGSSHWTNAARPVSATPVQFHLGDQIKQEQALDSGKLVGSAGVAPSCGANCGGETEPRHFSQVQNRQPHPTAHSVARAKRMAANPTLNRSAMPAPRQEQIFASHEAPEEEETKSERRVRFAGKNDD